MLVAGRKLSNLNVTWNGKATGNGEDAEEGDEDEGDTSDLRPLALDVEVGMVLSQPDMGKLAYGTGSYRALERSKWLGTWGLSIGTDNELITNHFLRVC